MSKFKTLVRNFRFLTKHDLRKNKTLNTSYEEMLENMLYYVPNSSVQRPNVLNAFDTLEMLCNTNKSIARFGDGELELIKGKDIPFKKYDPGLAKRMREMLLAQNPNILIGINHSYFYPVYDSTQDEPTKIFNLFSMPKYRQQTLNLIDISKQYVDAGFTSIRTDAEEFFQKIRKIWDNRDILLVACPQAYKKYTHNIFDNAKTNTYIDVPNKHSFSEYENILEQITKYPSDTLVILMAGPASKVLVADLDKRGYRALDLGHLAKAYDYHKCNKSMDKDNVIAFFAPDE